MDKLGGLQSGAVTVATSLYLGQSYYSSGTYTLTGSGTLIVGSGGQLRVGRGFGVRTIGMVDEHIDIAHANSDVGIRWYLGVGIRLKIGSLINGTLFQGTTLNGLGSATLEITRPHGDAGQQQGDDRNLATGTPAGSGAYGL